MTKRTNLTITLTVSVFLTVTGCTNFAGKDKTCSRRPKLAADSIKLLSKRGSTRATFYTMANKIVTIDGKTHVAWLDSVSDTMVAIYDHASGNWTEPVKVGTGRDNHGGPALTCDSEGYLHIIFGAHFIEPFHYSRSTRPNDSTSWTAQPDFGVNATYPSMACDENDTLHVIYRNEHTELYYQRLPAGGSWSAPVTLASAPPSSSYAAFGNNILAGPDNTLHVGYGILYTASDGRHCQAGHMMSTDGGDTWTLADGSVLDLPVTSADDVFIERSANVLSMAIDSQGHPWLGVAAWGQPARIYHHDGKTWHSIVPQERLIATEVKLEENLEGSTWRWGMPLSLDTEDGIYMMARTADSVAVIYSADRGKTFQVLDIFPRNEKQSHIGLSMERAGSHNAVKVPFLLFCMGGKGSDTFDQGIFHDVRAVKLTK